MIVLFGPVLLQGLAIGPVLFQGLAIVGRRPVGLTVCWPVGDVFNGVGMALDGFRTFGVQKVPVAKKMVLV